MAIGKSDGSVVIDTLIDTKGFNRGVVNMKKSVSGLTGTIGKLGAAIGIAFGVKTLINFGKEAMQLGSDLQEVQNVVDVTFEEMSDSVNDFAKNAITQFGLSEKSAKQYASTMGAMLKSMGFTVNNALDMSIKLAGLAGDVASFYNLTSDEAFAKIRAGISGETEPLKQLGINLSVANLEAYALSQGLTKAYNAMTEQEKTMLKYQYLLKATADAQGDFARTSNSWANQTRILSEQFNSLKATIGQGLINVFTPVVRAINVVLAKLQTLANAFKSLTEYIFGKQEIQNTKSTASALGDVQQGYDDVAASANKATKAQKGNLSSLEELNVISMDASASSGGGVGGGAGFSEMTKVEEDAKDANNAISKLMERVRELAELFKKGFAEGLGDTAYRLQSLKDSVESIKKSLAYIFDDELTEGFNNALDRIVYSLGVITGSFASVGLTIATNLVGGIARYLEQNKDFIKNYLLQMFDIGASLWEKAGELASTIAYIFEEFASEAGQQLTANFIGIFANSFMNISLLASKLGLDILTLITEPIKNSKEQLRSAFGNLIVGYEEFTASIKQVLDDVFGIISQTYTKYISPIFERLIPELEKTWQEHVAPLVSNIGNFFKVLGESISLVWNKTLKPVIEWIGNAIMPVVSSVVEFISNQIINNLFRTIVDVTNGITEILKGIVEFIAGVLALDIKSALQGIVDIFEGIFETIEAIVGFFVDSIVNKIKEIGSAVGGIGSNIINFFNEDSGTSATYAEPTSAKTYSMPYLATGAVIPPNAPFAAVLGDQKHGTNIEAPLSTIEQAVSNVLDRRGNSIGGDIVIQIDGREIFRVTQKQANDYFARTGRPAYPM